MASSITADNIKLMKSEVLLDTTDGGGRMTTQEITAGESNNLFPDTSSLDRVYGRLNLRKAFLSVQTQNTESLMGANVIVAKKPEDENIDVTLFSTEDWFDRRAGAQNLLEQYVARGTLWAGHLLETQLKGQRSVQIAVRQADDEPKVDQCLYLVENEGLASEFYQYVRVEKVTSKLRTFTVDGNDVVRKVVTIDTTVPLRYTFTGCTVPEYEKGKVPAAKLRDTQVADASRYYGTRAVKSTPKIGDRNILADSVFAQLVPTTQAETVIANHNAAGLKTLDAAAADGTFKQTVSNSATNGNYYTFNLGMPVLKGSLTITKSPSYGMPVLPLTDNDGIVIIKDTGEQVGRIEYSSGIIYLLTQKVSTNCVFSFTPAAETVSPTHTDIIQITQDARGYNYVKTLLPKPIPGTLAVSYQSLDTVYYLYDNGHGEIKGANDGIGAGTIDYTSGTVTLSTGALPDADSAVLFSWQTNADAIVRNEVLDWYYVLPLPDNVVSPYGTISQSGYMDTATIGANGITLKGENIGYYNPDNRSLYLRKGSSYWYGNFSLNWSSGALVTHNAALPPNNPKPILPGSVSMRFNVPFEVRKARVGAANAFAGVGYSATGYASYVDVYTVSGAESISDDGAGNLLQNGAIVGTIDYTTHAVIFDVEKLQVSATVTTYKGIGSGETSLHSGALSQLSQNSALGTVITPQRAAAAFAMTFRETGDDVKSGSASLKVARVEAKLPTYYGYSMNKLKGLIFSDGFKPFVGGTISNSIVFKYDEASKTVTGTDYFSGVNSLGIVFPLSYFKTESTHVSEVHFRAPAKPLRAGSVQVMFQHEGKTLSYVADAQGKLTGEHISGTVDYKTGVVSANFKTKVKTDSGEVETDLPVDVSTLRFNAVAFRNIPLDADLLGVDPVRLPADGRVPVFRNGNVAVLHNTQSYRLNAPAAGKVYNVGRTRLSAVKVYDSNGKALDSAMYSCDLDAGTVTLTSSFRSDGLQLPLTAEHRIEDMGVVADVQINGLVSLTVPVTHDYPEEGTLLSSALVAGDLQARAYNVFTQKTWGNAWADSTTDVVTAKYDTANYPIQVLNDGATEERWALIFTSAKNFRIVGENSGQIAEGTTDTVTAPINAITQKPYFTIPAGGWGGGWASGMVLRFNTAAANYPVWVARTVLPGQSTQLEDKFCLMVRGDVDR